MKLSTNSVRRVRRRGQTIVETAMVLTLILLPLTVGILQFGIVLNATNTLTQLAREGGRYAAVRHTDEEIRAYIVKAAAGTSIREAELRPPGSQASLDSRIIIEMLPNTATRVSGNPIQVRINYPMSNKIFIGKFPGVSLIKPTYVAQSTFVLE
ncbi:TadE-like protein [Abditibacterium utsteinense]|uniref:TadE-like protein n=1 Tax=Abditibacterium utsteinense TaxID=1960156 RepID=A0A2S8SXC0_9BACT|nr:TadE/TadG family type IV pilus assembly protein [Abditibacterium utsteinense]PQV65452.1 TadE-like protein [Abditibacterium utsteinense]